jgi:thiamine phosphate synthase YjbQ (UPF0047 family)
MIFQKEITIRSKAFDSIYNITDEVASIVSESSIKDGIVNIFHIGSTESITTIEFFVHGWTYAA